MVLDQLASDTPLHGSIYQEVHRYVSPANVGPAINIPQVLPDRAHRTPQPPRYKIAIPNNHQTNKAKPGIPDEANVIKANDSSDTSNSEQSTATTG